MEATRITDFNPAQDRSRLFGGGYLLGPSPVSGVSGTALFHDSDGNGTLDLDADELIGDPGTAAITAANTLDTAESPAPMGHRAGRDRRHRDKHRARWELPCHLHRERQPARRTHPRTRDQPRPRRSLIRGIPSPPRSATPPVCNFGEIDRRP
ncbi:MAG: hypothetical protein R3F11_18840 [Verrucomicrobiales bacterium]